MSTMELLWIVGVGVGYFVGVAVGYFVGRRNRPRVTGTRIVAPSVHVTSKRDVDTLVVALRRELQRERDRMNGDTVEVASATR